MVRKVFRSTSLAGYKWKTTLHQVMQYWSNFNIVLSLLDVLRKLTCYLAQEMKRHTLFSALAANHNESKIASCLKMVR